MQYGTGFITSYLYIKSGKLIFLEPSHMTLVVAGKPMEGRNEPILASIILTYTEPNGGQPRLKLLLSLHDIILLEALYFSPHPQKKTIFLFLFSFFVVACEKSVWANPSICQ